MEHVRVAECHVSHAIVTRSWEHSTHRQTKATSINVFDKYVFCAIGIDPCSITRLNCETVILIPNTAAVDVNVAASNIKAVSVEGIHIPQVMVIRLVDPGAHGAISYLHPRNIQSSESPIRRIYEMPPLHQDVRSIVNAEQARPVLAMKKVLQVSPPRFAISIHRASSGTREREPGDIGNKEGLLNAKLWPFGLQRVEVTLRSLLLWPTRTTWQELKRPIQVQCHVLCANEPNAARQDKGLVGNVQDVLRLE
mmetsp:Transcript_73602/g.172399  ORF Transcript_73602/g.172399 Transcript_73602/m.172399 type:complete len:252 (-) Transcript_73602:146-901(-)